MYANWVSVIPQSNPSSGDEPGRTVRLNLPVYEKAASLAKKYDTNLRKLVNDYILAYTERVELLERLKPFLTLLSVQDHSMFIKDAKANEVFEVQLIKDKDKDIVELICLQDKLNDCIHTVYALASPELGKLSLSFKKMDLP